MLRNTLWYVGWALPKEGSGPDVGSVAVRDPEGPEPFSNSFLSAEKKDQ